MFMTTSTPSMAPEDTAALSLTSSLLWATKSDHRDLVEYSDSYLNKCLATRTEPIGGGWEEEAARFYKRGTLRLLCSPEDTESHYSYPALSIWKCGKSWWLPEEASQRVLTTVGPTWLCRPGSSQSHAKTPLSMLGHNGDRCCSIELMGPHLWVRIIVLI